MNPKNQNVDDDDGIWTTKLFMAPYKKIFDQCSSFYIMRWLFQKQSIDDTIVWRHIVMIYN